MHDIDDHYICIVNVDDVDDNNDFEKHRHDVHSDDYIMLTIV